MSLQHCLPAFRSLKIARCPKLISLFAEGDDFKSLEELSISKCPRLVYFPKIGLASTLIKLRIQHCNVLQSLPDLTLLNDLERLEVHDYSSLTYLSSSSGLPPSIKELNVDDYRELISLIAEEGMKINCPSL